MSGALNIATRALNTNLAALQVIGNNIANVNTEGYSRQNVLLQSSGYQEFGNGFFGKGVEIATVRIVLVKCRYVSHAIVQYAVVQRGIPEIVIGPEHETTLRCER